MHWIFIVLHAHEALQAFEPDPLTCYLFTWLRDLTGACCARRQGL